MRDRAEHFRSDLGQGIEQKVHRPVGLIVGQLDEPLDRHPLGHPPGRRELRARFESALGHQREQHSLDRHAVVAAPEAEGLIDPDQASYFLSKIELTRGPAPTMARWRKRLFIATSYITAYAAEYFGLPHSRVVIMGSRIEV